MEGPSTERVPPMQQGHHPNSDPDEVTGGDSRVLGVIEEEELAGFTFEGLKRRIGSHPETLSRALVRLVERNMLEHAEEGYRLTDKGREWLSVHPLSMTEQRLTLVKTLLPPTVQVSQIFAELKGRWFGPLRWLGYSETPSELVLKWVTSDGSIQLDARLSQAELTIEGRLLQRQDLAGAVRASHQLLAHISRLYVEPRVGHAFLFAVSPFSSTPN